MSLSGLTHIWVEVSPVSNALDNFPDHVTVVQRADPADDPLPLALPAQAILASSLLQYNGALMDTLPNLKMIARTGIGVDNVNLDDATARNIVVTNTPDGPTESTAEHTVAMLLSMAKRLKQGNANLGEGKWGPRTGTLLGNEVRGKTLGLVGLGRIGRRVAHMCRLGFDMRVVGYDPFVSEEQALQMGVTLAPLEDVVIQADFVSVHVPATPQTHHLINGDLIAQMKDGSYVINVSRGPLVDAAALLEAVDSGKLAGAALDVFEPEPPELDSRLRNHPQIIATPHIAGVTMESRTRMEHMAVERVTAFFSGQRPENVVNPAVYAG